MIRKADKDGKDCSKGIKKDGTWEDLAQSGRKDVPCCKDIKMSTTSSDTKEANALDISANPVEPTTSNANRTLEHSKGADNLTDTENDDDDDDIDGKSNSREEKTAPIELMGEFLKAVMERDYKLSSKLCQMILLYEPENPEAKQFKELLEIKIKLESWIWSGFIFQDGSEYTNQ
ncbi:glutamate-rich protein 2 isoform X5 [Leucoraja erinacea]|uniref:glutamate-rich protein 2 isoform X5 n=1 Tax=Leucoraja erinaceus TaxID=7782 RepID=UPI0024553AF6|nr:glutamate-rich protein 2 isoform X5 [Leucoraja erinacea]